MWGLEEEDARQAFVIWDAVTRAFSKASLPLKYLNAASDTPEEAARRAYLINRAKGEAAAGFRQK